MKQILTPNAPKPIGSYSQAIISRGFIFLSGQVGINTKGELISGLESQVKQIFQNIESVLEAADASVSDLVKVTIFLKDMSYFARVNDLYGMWVNDPFPARSTIAVSELPLNALVEIECTAKLPK